MPFDATPLTETDLHRARRALLAARLRTDKTWCWNFCDSIGCAIGMAHETWRYGDIDKAGTLANFLGLTADQYGPIFGFINPIENEDNIPTPSEYSPFYNRDRREVTPDMVADALEALG